jgi:hypothetical protein
MGWLFLLLGLAFTVIAIHPGWRRRWAWGRGGQGGPLSAFGWVSWILAFFVIAACGFTWINCWWVFAAVGLVFTAAVFDGLRGKGPGPTGR